MRERIFEIGDLVTLWSPLTINYSDKAWPALVVGHYYRPDPGIWFYKLLYCDGTVNEQTMAILEKIG